MKSLLYLKNPLLVRRGFKIGLSRERSNWLVKSILKKQQQKAMAVSKTRGADNRGQKLTPEIYFARKLAANDKKTRDKTLKKLKKWVTARSSVPDGRGNILVSLWLAHFWLPWIKLQRLANVSFWSYGKDFFTACGCPTSLWFRKI